MIKELLIVMMLIAPACAWTIQNGTVQNMTETELLNVVATCINAGAATDSGVVAKTLYDMGGVSYAKYHEVMMSNNMNIALYNAMMEDHFNKTICAQWKYPEYAI